jgi:hypothetical protein
MKTHLHNTIAAFILAATAFISGCATSDGTSVTKADVITAAEIAAGIVIDNDARVDEALKVVRDARQFIQTGQSATVDGLAEYIITRALQSQDLSPGQVSAIKSFFRRYTDTMTLELDQIGVDPDVIVTANEVLDAVERVALEIRRYGAPLERSYATAPEPLDESLLGYLTDRRTRDRYPLSLTARESAKVDPKWHDGLRWMRDNPQPLPEGL